MKGDGVIEFIRIIWGILLLAILIPIFVSSVARDFYYLCLMYIKIPGEFIFDVFEGLLK